MKIDTEEMKRIANEINNLATQYQNKINKFYLKLSDMPNSSAWTGNSANRYARAVLLDKPDMLRIGDKIKDYSKSIVRSANTLDEMSKKEERD
jgi:uncharacterized protein YukE